MKNLTRIQKRIWDEFTLDTARVTPKLWHMTKAPCPWCGKRDKFGIRFNEERKGKHKHHLVFNCFKCSESGADFLLFKKLDLLSFYKDGEFIKQDKIVLVNQIKQAKEDYKKELILDVPNKLLPLGYRRVKYDDYLHSRGFEDWQYDMYSVGRTKLVHKLKNYILFSIEEDGENKGYLARHFWSKEEIKKYEKDTGQMVIRYANQGGVDFDKLLFGIDEITPNTTTVILVEGSFDKTNVDKELGLNRSEAIKCLCTFGKQLSEVQAAKLRKRGVNVKRVYLMYDNDAVRECKRYSDLLSEIFEEVRACFIPIECDKDAGDFIYDEIVDLLKSAQDPINFRFSKLQKRILLK